MINVPFLVESIFFFSFFFGPQFLCFSGTCGKVRTALLLVPGSVSDFIKHLKIFHASASPCKTLS